MVRWLTTPSLARVISATYSSGVALPGITALFTPSIPMASAPEWRTCALSSSSTLAPCSAAVIAAMVPAVPPPTIATSQLSFCRSATGGMSMPLLSVIRHGGPRTAVRRAGRQRGQPLVAGGAVPARRRCRVLALQQRQQPGPGGGRLRCTRRLRLPRVRHRHRGLDAAGPQHRHPVPDEQRLVHVVGDE